MENSEEEKEEKQAEEKDQLSEEAPKKKFKLGRPNPLILIFIIPPAVVMAAYIIVSNLLLSSDLQHEAKIEQVLAALEPDTPEEMGTSSENDIDSESVENKDEDGEALLPESHNYYEFGVPFNVNVKSSDKILTFQIAISTFQTAIPALFFIEGFDAFVPAVRSAIIFAMGSYTLEELTAQDAQEHLVLELKDVINNTLEGLGAKPEVDKVLFRQYIIT